MDITVNGAPHNMKVEPTNTLGQVYQELVQSLAQSGKVVSSVQVNGESLPGGRIWDLASSPISDIHTLELAIQEVDDMVRDTLASTDEHLENLVTEIEKTANMFRIGDELEAHQRLGTCISGLQWFLRALNTFQSFLHLDFTQMTLAQTTAEEAVQEFVPVVDDLLDAQSEGDVILMADLLEYELAPKLTQWKGFLPELEQKALKSHTLSNPSD
jgi:hypothetical protein